MLKHAFVLAAFLATGFALNLEALGEFESFKVKFNKNYANEVEEASRLEIFAQNLEKIRVHNAKGASYQLGVTQFADFTDEEFKKYSHGYVNVKKYDVGQSYSFQAKDLPTHVDWRDHGAMTAVKDQGQCGSCWAFATVQQLESYLYLSGALGDNATAVELSPQQIVSCSPNPMHCGGTGGCSGSIVQMGFTYTQLFGVVKEADYPYTSGTLGFTGRCKYHAESMEAAVYTRGYETLPRNNIEAVMNHLATVGPLAIGADASSWSLYRGGVFDGCSYDRNIEIDHAIQLVGYGTDEEHGDYWLVRNSWGDSWGEEGYIRLKRESELVCGTDNTPSVGTGCSSDGNDVQKVCGMCGLLFDVAYPIGAGNVNTIKP